jgi:hypothetical protein
MANRPHSFINGRRSTTWLVVLVGLWFGSTVHAQVPVNSDAAVSISYTGLVLNRRTQTLDTVATLRNVSGSALRGPISLVLTKTSPAELTLTNRTATTLVGQPVIAIGDATVVLASAASTSVTLKFRPLAGNRAFTFRASVLAAPDTLGPPTEIGSIVPDGGPSGSLVQIFGRHFSPTSTATFGGIPARTFFLTPTSLVAIVPFAPGSALASLAEATVGIRVDGGSSVPFRIAALPANTGPSGEMLSETLTNITADFIAGETDQRQALAAASSETTDPTIRLYINALANLITPLQALATTAFPQLISALDSNALALLDRTILATRTANPQTVTALGSAGLLDGDRWLQDRYALVKSQKAAWSISTALTFLCGEIAVESPAHGAVCQLAAAAANVISTIQNFQLGQYGLVVGVNITASRAIAANGDLLVETYPTRPAVLNAKIRTQRQLNAEDWVITAIQLPLSLIGLNELDPTLLTTAAKKTVGELSQFLDILNVVNLSGLPKTEPIIDRLLTFTHLTERFQLSNPFGCVPIVANDGTANLKAPLPQPVSCHYGIEAPMTILTEWSEAAPVTLFTPALETDIKSIDFVAYEGSTSATGRTVTIQAFAEPGVPADPDVTWIAGQPTPGTLGSGRVELSRISGTLREGVVAVSVNTLFLPPGEYDAMLQIDASDLNQSPQQIPVHVKVKAVHVVIGPPTAAANVGDSVVFTAELQDDLGTPVAGAQFEWIAGDSSIATVDVNGIATGVADGQTTITARDTVSGASAAAQLTVRALSVVITPTSPVLNIGDDVALIAELQDANGTPVSGTNFRWSTSDESIVSVDQHGNVSGIADGVATITATETVSGEKATVNVSVGGLHVEGDNVVRASGSWRITIESQEDQFDLVLHTTTGASRASFDEDEFYPPFAIEDDDPLGWTFSVYDNDDAEGTAPSGFIDVERIDPATYRVRIEIHHGIPTRPFDDAVLLFERVPKPPIGAP